MTNLISAIDANSFNQLQDEFRTVVLEQTDDYTEMRKVNPANLSVEDMVDWYNFFKGELELLQLQ